MAETFTVDEVAERLRATDDADALYQLFKRMEAQMGHDAATKRWLAACAYADAPAEAAR